MARFSTPQLLEHTREEFSLALLVISASEDAMRPMAQCTSF